LAFGVEFAAHGFGALGSDKEAKTGAALLAGVGIVDAIELLENMGEVGLRNADAGITDGNHDFLLVANRRNIDTTAIRSILEGVFEELIDNLA